LDNITSFFLKKKTYLYLQNFSFIICWPFLDSSLALKLIADNDFDVEVFLFNAALLSSFDCFIKAALLKADLLLQTAGIFLLFFFFVNLYSLLSIQ
jgi:hypothetical protein